MSETRQRLQIVPMDLSDANEFIRRHHRHHPPVVGHKFSLGVVDEAGAIRGVATIGRPVARRLDDGWTLEVNRVATDGCPNACSALYGADSPGHVRPRVPKTDHLHPARGGRCFAAGIGLEVHRDGGGGQLELQVSSASRQGSNSREIQMGG